ncbi:HRDC domain-containing protein [Candidatus Woesearchaeota archaeon]|nr:HRDC domain-containing protein [Candidatus Woesearchaeota archaeon]
MTTFTFIDTIQKLETAAKEWRKEKVLAIDLECENNLHHYGSYLALIQISSKTNHWILDLLVLKEVDSLVKILQNSKIQKVFHDVGFDFRILHHQLKCRPKNIFDTQVAALLLGRTELGLGSLFEHYLKLKKESKFQMADWTKRPLATDMLEYAIKDTKYLIEIRDLLIEDLKKKNRFEWAEEEFKYIENKNVEYKEGGYKDITGYKAMEPHERATLKRLFILREKLAKKVDRPVHFILATKKIVSFSIRPPKNLLEWRKMREVHPVVRNYAKEFYEEIQKGKKESITVSLSTKKHYTPAQKEKLKQLLELREKIGTKLHLPKHLILSKDQMHDITVTGTFDSLRSWQKKLVE